MELSDVIDFQMADATTKCTVDVLHVGYSVNEGSFMRANCTCCLIRMTGCEEGERSGSVNVIVDTMTAWDGDKIEAALAQHGLKCRDVHYVICTHGHSDHIGSNYLFQSAKYHIVGTSVSNKDEYPDIEFPINLGGNDDVQVMKTPGHTLDSVSVLVKTSEGLVAIVGDLFEREEDIEQPELWKVTAGSEDEKKQEESRKKVLNIADYIVPGHGPIFKVLEKYRS